MPAQPVHRPADARVAGGDAGRHEAGHGASGPVDVVDAPAAEPRAVRLLLGEQPLGPGGEGPFPPCAFRPGGGQGFEDVTGDVGGGHVEHRTVVVVGQALGEFGERRQVAGLVGGPPALAGLEAGEPAAAPCDRGRQVGRQLAVLVAEPRERGDDHGGVVHVRVGVQPRRERPAAGGHPGPVALPVAAGGRLPGGQPGAGACDRGVRGIEPGVQQGEQRVGRVPHRAGAGHDPAGGAVRRPDRFAEAVQRGERGPVGDAVGGVAQGLEGQRAQGREQEHVEPGPVRLLVAQQPQLRPRQRAVAQRAQRAPVVGPHHPFRRARPGGGGRCGSVQFGQVEPGRPDRSRGRDDRQRREQMPRPHAQRAHRDRDAGREQYLLGQNGRDAVPAPDAEQREPEVGLGTCRAEPAVVPAEFRGRPHVRLLGPVTGQPQREVRLGGHGQVPRPPGEHRPRPVVVLSPAHPQGGARERGRVVEAQAVAGDDVGRFGADVGVRSFVPPAVVVLTRQEVVDAAGEGLVGGGVVHSATGSPSLRAERGTYRCRTGSLCGIRATIASF